ncbi:MAG: hypothetical protein ACI4IQ_06215, partial [Eubacterium sp.]
MKRFLKIFLSVVLCIVLILGLSAGGFFLLYRPSLTADFSLKTGAVTSGASGYLYGIAEEGVPSKNMTESIDISTVSQKVPNGLQHPIGDIDHVYTQLDNTVYNVVYLQDMYSTWYYENDNINKMRFDGTYDWKEFITDDYLPKVKESVEYLSKTSYSDKVVYCLYNECDNGVWFGETMKTEDNTGAYGVYNEQGADNFFEAWKMTYELVKSVNPNALIGGPGFCDYDHNEINSFLTYCSENGCLPEIMIYHELSDISVYHWQSHVRDYRDIEKNLGINELPIIVTEYGRMQDNGLPGKMLQYITQIEASKVYADNAYWRLADNLCDVASDDNSPNSNWWLYRWYADMEGQTVDIKYQDLFKSNVEKYLKKEAELSSQGFMGVVSISDEEDKIDIICGGRDGSAVVKLKNIDKTAFDGKRVNITVEEVLYKGISGVVNSPELIKHYTTTVKGSTLKIDMKDMDEANAYHITIVPADEKEADYQYDNTSYTERYEFENATLLANAYTYDSAYATTGEINGMVGGMENEGDGVELTFSVPEDGEYDLNIIFGNSNDGQFDENGRQNPDDRVDSTSIVNVDGNEAVISFPNTIKSEYTDCLTMTYELSKGKHTISFKHDTGTIVLDSLLVTQAKDNELLSVLKDSDRTNEATQSYLAVAPSDGYYDIYIDDDSNAQTAYVNDVEFSVKDENVVYLMRGLNYIDVITDKPLSEFHIAPSQRAWNVISVEAQSAKLSSGARICTNEAINVEYLDSISCDGSKAEYKVNVEKAGTYAMTILYANNDEGGKHDYNVDLIERYVTVTAGGKSQ